MEISVAEWRKLYPGRLPMPAEYPLGQKYWPKLGLDLGDGHWLTITQDAFKNGYVVGGVIIHTPAQTESGWCEGGITFDVPQARPLNKKADGSDQPVWQVSEWKPLTLSPSFLCHCGDHGFIKQGRWQRA